MDDRDHRVNFVAIIWKRSQTIGTIEGYPTNHHSFPITPSSRALNMATENTELNMSLFMEKGKNTLQFITNFVSTIRISL